MLDTAQILVGLLQRGVATSALINPACWSVLRARRVCRSWRAGWQPAKQQLQNLHEKFNFPNPSQAQLDVRARLDFISDLSVDLLFHAPQLTSAFRVKMPLVYEGLDKGHELRAEMRITGHRAGSEQGHFFPRLSKAGIVSLIGQERQGQLALRAVWALAISTRKASPSGPLPPTRLVSRRARVTKYS